MMQYARDPEECHRELLTGVVLSAAGGLDERTGKDSRVYPNVGPVLDRDSLEHQRVASITERILKAANTVVDKRVARLQAEHGPWTRELIENGGEDSSGQIRPDATEFFELRSAQRSLRQRWRVVILNSAPPNAFVTDSVPRHVFVNAGILQPEWLKEEPGQAALKGLTDDELAMVVRALVLLYM